MKRKRRSRKGREAPIRLAILGLGRAGGSGQLAELARRREKFRVVHVCDVDPARAEAIAAREACRWSVSMADMLADPEIEMVSVATRSVDHAAHAEACIRAGKAVFVEKPMAVRHAEAAKVVKLARRRRVPLYVRHNRRFEPAFREIQDVVASRVLGEIFEVKLRRWSYQRRDDWQMLRRFGGGQLLNWGPHILDHALCFLEAPVASLWCDLQRVAGAGDAEDHVKVLLRGRNGRVVDLEISGGAALGDDEWLVLGSSGALRCTGERILVRHLDPKKKLPPRRADPCTPAQSTFIRPDQLHWLEREVPVRPKYRQEGTEVIWDFLFNAHRKGDPFPITTAQALEVMRLIDLCRSSARVRNVGR